MATELMNAYSTGVLNPEIHSRLAANLEGFARRANIMESNILHKMSDFACTKTEIEYVRALRRMAAANVYGLVYTGKETKPVLTRMMGMAGACLRNFTEARVVTLQELLASMKEGERFENVSVLLVPNFFVAKSEGGTVASWHIAELLGLLYARMAKGQQTVLYVSDADALRKTYGDPIANHLSNHFRAVAA